MNKIKIIRIFKSIIEKKMMNSDFVTEKSHINKETIFYKNKITQIFSRKTSLFHFIICINLFLSIILCGCTTSELTPQDAMTQFKVLSPREGAEYYMENRENYSFMDSLYCDSIMPAVLHCNFFDIDSVKNVLQGTKFEKEIMPVYQNKRSELLENLDKELGIYNKNQCLAFEKHYIPALEMSIDSMLQKDVEDIMDNYAGGFLGYKKLAFLFGRGRNDFKKIFWEKFDTIKYQNQIRNYIQDFYNTVQIKQNSYSKDLIGKDFKAEMTIEVPLFPVGLSQSTLSYVKKYTNKQKEEIITEAIKDYAVPLVIGTISGGLSTIYDIGSTVYDINQIMDELKDMKISDDDMVKYICEHDLSYQIKYFYLNKWFEQVFEQITKSNQQLYNYIKINL